MNINIFIKKVLFFTVLMMLGVYIFNFSPKLLLKSTSISAQKYDNIYDHYSFVLPTGWSILEAKFPGDTVTISNKDFTIDDRNRFSIDIVVLKKNPDLSMDKFMEYRDAINYEATSEKTAVTSNNVMSTETDVGMLREISINAWNGYEFSIDKGDKIFLIAAPKNDNYFDQFMSVINTFSIGK